MEQSVNAIVLRRRDSGESDRRLTLLTEQLGKIDVIAKGARKAASRLSGSSDPLSVAVMNLADGKVNKFVTQSQPITSFRGLRQDYDRLSQALALCELYAAVLPGEEVVPDAYTLLLQSLALIEAHTKPLVALVWAETQLMDLSGFLPQLEQCVTTGQRLNETFPYVSAMAGGFVCFEEAARFSDRVQVRREALLGVSKVATLETPPPNLRFAEECLGTLMHFWRDIAGIPLPANEALVAQVVHLAGV